MAESKTSEANYRARDDILMQDDTTLPVNGVALSAAAQALITTARAQHLAKMDAEATAREARAATPYGGNVTSGTIKRAKQ